MENPTKLSRSIIPEVDDLYRAYADKAGAITDRVDYVIRKIASIFKTKVDWWDWDNGSCEAEIDGHFEPSMLKEETVQLHGQFKSSGEKVAMIDGGEWDFSYLEFPRKFLFEDFEQKLEDGIIEYKHLLEKQKTDRAKKKEEAEAKKKMAIQAAKNKLTKEERKALGIR